MVLAVCRCIFFRIVCINQRQCLLHRTMQLRCDFLSFVAFSNTSSSSCVCALTAISLPYYNELMCYIWASVIMYIFSTVICICRLYAIMILIINFAWRHYFCRLIWQPLNRLWSLYFNACIFCIAVFVCLYSWICCTCDINKKRLLKYGIDLRCLFINK